MTGVRSYTTKIWRQPSSIGFSSADALSTSMDPPGEPVISTQKRPCQKIQNGSEFPELVAQNFRNPHRKTYVVDSTGSFLRLVSRFCMVFGACCSLPVPQSTSPLVILRERVDANLVQST